MKGDCLQETTAVSTELASFITQVKGGLTDFTSANLGTIILAGLGVAVAPALFWMAYRFVKGKAVKAFTKGKI